MNNSDALDAARIKGSSAYFNPASLENIEEMGIGTDSGCLSQDKFNQRYGFSEMTLLSFNRKLFI
jgi:hypothetical protein